MQTEQHYELRLIKLPSICHCTSTYLLYSNWLLRHLLHVSLLTVLPPTDKNKCFVNTNVACQGTLGDRHAQSLVRGIGLSQQWIRQELTRHSARRQWIVVV